MASWRGRARSTSRGPEIRPGGGAERFQHVRDPYGRLRHPQGAERRRFATGARHPFHGAMTMVRATKFSLGLASVVVLGLLSAGATQLPAQDAGKNPPPKRE